MEQEMLQVLNNFGVVGLWGIVLYQVIDLVEVVVGFFIVGFGIKKAWPAIKEMLDDM